MNLWKNTKLTGNLVVDGSKRLDEVSPRLDRVQFANEWLDERAFGDFWRVGEDPDDGEHDVRAFIDRQCLHLALAEKLQEQADLCASSVMIPVASSGIHRQRYLLANCDSFATWYQVARMTSDGSGKPGNHGVVRHCRGVVFRVLHHLFVDARSLVYVRMAQQPKVHNVVSAVHVELENSHILSLSLSIFFSCCSEMLYFAVVGEESLWK